MVNSWIPTSYAYVCIYVMRGILAAQKHILPIYIYQREDVKMFLAGATAMIIAVHSLSSELYVGTRGPTASLP